jgi:hypothetical protein
MLALEEMKGGAIEEMESGTIEEMKGGALDEKTKMKHKKNGSIASMQGDGVM